MSDFTSKMGPTLSESKRDVLPSVLHTQRIYLAIEASSTHIKYNT